MVFLVIRGGKIQTSYGELPRAVVNDTRNVLCVIDPAKYAQLQKSKTIEYTPTVAEINLARKEMRRIMFSQDTDALKFKADAGEIDKQVWLDARSAIKNDERFKDIIEG